MYAYPASKKAPSRARQVHRSRPDRPSLDGAKPKIVTVVPPELRSRLDCGTQTVFANVHVDSLASATSAIRAHRAAALIITADAIVDRDTLSVERLLSASPGLLAIGIVTDSMERSSFVTLGAARVHHVIDLAGNGGWNSLRAVAETLGGEARQRIQEYLLNALANSTDEVRSFFGALLRWAPDVSTTRGLSDLSHVHASTLNSRFFRAGLPAPKKYLAMARLAYASAYFEQTGTSIAAVAMRLGYSSPQSFSRHVRQTLGMTSGAFRRDIPLARMMDLFDARLIRPYLKSLACFRPLANPPIHRSSMTSLARVAER